MKKKKERHWTKDIKIPPIKQRGAVFRDRTKYTRKGKSKGGCEGPLNFICISST